MNYFLKHPYIRRVLCVSVLDALCLAAAAGVSWSLGHPLLSPELFVGATIAGFFLCFAALFYCDAYRPEVLGDAHRTNLAVGSSMAIAFAVAILVYFAVPVPAGAVDALATAAVAYFPLLVVERAAFRGLAQLPRFSNRAVIIGASDLGVRVANAIHERGNAGIELVGFLTDEVEDLGRGVAGYPAIGRVHELEKLIDARGVGIVVVASKSREEYFPAETLLAAKLRGCRVESGVSFFEKVTGRIYLRDLRPSYLIFADGFREGPVSQAARRSLDIAVASVALLLATPVLALCALAIKLDSKGPVFFRQERVGRGGRPFRVVKLRSMCNDAEALGARFAERGDMRITRVGRILRASRLDEVPQLWNVLVGDMSMVGPRPERPEFVDSLCLRYPYFRLRSAIRPGITGWAQVRYGYVNEIEGFEEKLALDLYYMKHRSLAMDFVILWQTVKTVFLFRGI
ncbi:MAG: sugar transferase [Myxococcota bacterium]